MQVIPSASCHPLASTRSDRIARIAEPDEDPMHSPIAALSEPYPTSGLIAKDETQVSSFLKRFPDYDGRGIRVAVLDSGIDPATFGLNGKNKIVDILDCTGTCKSQGQTPRKLIVGFS